MEIRTDNVLLSVTPDYWPHMIMGIVLFGASSFCYIRWKEGWATWTRILGEIKPNLQASDSPFNQTLSGCGGLVAALVNATLTILFWVMAVDQLVFMGRLWERLVRLVSGQIPLM